MPPELATQELEETWSTGVPAEERSAASVRLTARQSQALALMMKGRSNKAIAGALGLAERTVKVHVTAVLNALKVTSRTQAVIAAGRLGLVSEDLLAAAKGHIAG